MFLPFFDFQYLVFMLPAILLGAYAQWKVSATYARFAEVPNSAGLAGYDVARRILAHAGLQGVGVEVIDGELTDHYDPRAKVLRLSRPVATSSTVASEGIVAHEIGHAMQDHLGYLPMRLRSGILPIANFGQHFAWLLVFGGLLLSTFVHLPVVGFEIAVAGLVLFFAVFAFQLVTLPVELDASRRALVLLRGEGILSDAELGGTRKVLSAAALTYLAAVVGSLMTMLYYASLVFGAGRRD